MQKKPKKPIAILAAATMLLLVAVPVAAADNPNDTQYGNVATTLPNEPLTPPTVSTPTETTPTETTEPTETTPSAPSTESTPPPKTPVTQSTSPGVFTPPTKATEGTLPFTGVDLGLAFAIGLATIAGGFFLRRLGRAED